MIVSLSKQLLFLDEVFVNKNFKLNTALIEPQSLLKSNATNLEISNALTDDKGYIHPVKIIYYNQFGEAVKQKSAFETKDISSDIPMVEIHKNFAGYDL
ncbi:hypothetical protein [Carboxylicivirga caseinilyticus]|uniref:hypothetical protein n=1 Tax=Carboxylicivirga caseinilyticus TaxID=3417572 RepID=UPI003D32DBAA|nr:hypothetical protein [Marinilabiliaceae bacterium A049]